ncbi:MAG: hypothetical protein CM1200mP40_07080 [Gammaproteobacteria bacterium]|nr:MAG: hypothetical protein CM1200mP40_07080 [Gammaproteobacteria bacterium]
MRISTKHIAAALIGLFASAALTVQAQSTDNARFLSLAPPGGLPLIPVMEGWTANPDGTASYSYGIINRNDEPMDIPIGEANYMEPAKFDGNQPTHFPAGRTVGAFTVTVAADEREIDVWWYLKTGDSEPLRVPGRYGSSAYELDFILPRPQGAMQPLVGLGEDGAQRAGLYPQRSATIRVTLFKSAFPQKLWLMQQIQQKEIQKILVSRNQSRWDLSFLCIRDPIAAL